MQGTTKTLLALHEEIQRMQPSVLALFMRSKISDFYKHNGPRIDSFYEKRRKLQLEYFEVDGEKLKTEGEGDQKKPIVKEGKTREEFDKLFEEMMNQEINIKI